MCHRRPDSVSNTVQVRECESWRDAVSRAVCCLCLQIGNGRPAIACVSCGAPAGQLNQGQDAVSGIDGRPAVGAANSFCFYFKPGHGAGCIPSANRRGAGRRRAAVPHGRQSACIRTINIIKSQRETRFLGGLRTVAVTGSTAGAVEPMIRAAASRAAFRPALTV
jgi:hypothetical protein